MYLGHSSYGMQKEMLIWSAEGNVIIVVAKGNVIVLDYWRLCYYNNVPKERLLKEMLVSQWQYYYHNLLKEMV